ncbi:MAG TPA: DedA family protein [Candidatus Saccharimonadales bacterium]|nr:DedA family protein [Candidatus Saccharimonadales bacterium]
MNEFIHGLIHGYQNALTTQGYPLIVALMAMESTIVPIPSEAIIPFAAATGKLSLLGIVLAGTLGSCLGAAIMYWAARLAGRPLVLRYGGYFMLPEAKLHAAEQWASRFGSFGVFVARLLPVVRHLIGIPMGIVEMDFRWYMFFTLLGSALWCSVLAWVGVVAGHDAQLLKGDMHRITLWLVGAAAVLGLMYYFLVHRYMVRPVRPVGPGTDSK